MKQQLFRTKQSNRPDLTNTEQPLLQNTQALPECLLKQRSGSTTVVTSNLMFEATSPTPLLNLSRRLGILQVFLPLTGMLTVNDSACCYFTQYSLAYSHMPNQHFTELGVPVKGEPGLNNLNIILLEAASLCKSILKM